MMVTPHKKNREDKQRDETLLRMLKTLPKPHEKMKIGKPGRKQSKSPTKRKAVKKPMA
jgi:hypothetical protein